MNAKKLQLCQAVKDLSKQMVIDGELEDYVADTTLECVVDSTLLRLKEDGVQRMSMTKLMREIKEELLISELKNMDCDDMEIQEMMEDMRYALC